MLDLDLSILSWDIIGRFVAKGFVFSIQLTLIAMTGGILFGTLLALMRLSGRKWLDAPAAIYVNGMRSIPLVMVILWFFLLIPFLIGRSLGAELSAIITFVAFESAYYAEIMRAGIQSVSRGQLYAAQAVGMNYAQTMRLVVLPQAFRNMLPVLLTQTIILFQDTSLVYVISATDFLGAAAKIANRDGRLVEMYLFAAAIYFAISVAGSCGVKLMQQRLAVIR